MKNEVNYGQIPHGFQLLAIALITGVLVALSPRAVAHVDETDECDVCYDEANERILVALPGESYPGLRRSAVTAGDGYQTQWLPEYYSIFGVDDDWYVAWINLALHENDGDIACHSHFDPPLSAENLPAPCRFDSDGDGVLDHEDNCPDTHNPDQADSDGDGMGDGCDSDDDNDGVADTDDAFPLDPAESTDTDGDGIGNNADPDDDNDGVNDTDDAFPLDASETTDTDGDGIGDNADTDDDGDGLTDEEELELGTDPLNPDTDGDLVLDSLDRCPISDLFPTVWIAGCDSGVLNDLEDDLVDDEGCTLADLIHLAAVPHAERARNHGKFVSAMAKELNTLKKAGSITGDEKALLMDCIASIDREDLLPDD